MKTKTIKALTVLAIAAAALAATAGLSEALTAPTTDTLQASKPASTPSNLVVAQYYGGYGYGNGTRPARPPK